MPREDFLIGSGMMLRFMTRTILVELVKWHVFLGSKGYHDHLEETA